MDNQAVEIIEGVRSIVAYHQDIGIEGYPQHPGLAQFLEKKTDTEGGMKAVAPQRKTLSDVVQTLKEIELEIHACRNCELHARRVSPVAGRGGPRARLLIVGGWRNAPEQALPFSKTIFGQEEDLMLARMLEAIHLAPADVFVTNILKCGLPVSCQPVAANVQCCLVYLQREIAAIAPEVICAMGVIPARTLLGGKQSLSQLRGRFHVYTAPDGREIPLMPTYHPSYLLQAIEMKKETWKDLQLIERKLAG